MHDTVTLTSLGDGPVSVNYLDRIIGEASPAPLISPK